jgi:hypothetical protein
VTKEIVREGREPVEDYASGLLRSWVVAPLPRGTHGAETVGRSARG